MYRSNLNVLATLVIDLDPHPPIVAAMMAHHHAGVGATMTSLEATTAVDRRARTLPEGTVTALHHHDADTMMIADTGVRLLHHAEVAEVRPLLMTILRAELTPQMTTHHPLADTEVEVHLHHTLMTHTRMAHEVVATTVHHLQVDHRHAVGARHQLEEAAVATMPDMIVVVATGDSFISPDCFEQTLTLLDPTSIPCG